MAQGCGSTSWTGGRRRIAGGGDRWRLVSLAASLALAMAIGGCAEPDARSSSVTPRRWAAGAHALDAASFVVLVARQGPAGLTIERVATGELATLRPRERGHCLGEPAPERQEHALCARLLRQGSDTGLGRCVPWRPPHAAPGRGHDAASALDAGAVSIRLATPAAGDVWVLRDGAGAAARWPVPGTP